MSTSHLRPEYAVPLALAAAAIFTPSLVRAQTTAGLIGTRHVEVSAFFESIDISGVEDGLGFGLRANLPLHPVVDLALSGSTEQIDTNDYEEQTAFATLVAHWDARDLTPYLVAGVGNVWQSVTIAGEKISDDEMVYLAGVGLEAPIGDRTALGAHATYHRYSSDDVGDYWIYGVSLNHWFGPSVGATMAVNFRESDSMIFSAGAVFRF